jgi:outer membrane protein
VASKKQIQRICYATLARSESNFNRTAVTAYQRVAVTDELLKEANLALQLAQTRYKLGLSSIVELSQAQFQQTDAAIGNTDAQYQYRLALASLNYQTGANQ